MSEDGYITPPPGLLPPPPEPRGVPEREQIPAVPGGFPLFTPNPALAPRTAPTIPAFRPTSPPAPSPVAEPEARLETPPAAVPTLAPAPQWQLVLPDGSQLVLSGASYLGRNPVVTDAAPGAALLPLADPMKSLSKTHALLVPQLDYLMVTDLHSTNGIAVVAPNGAVTVLEPGRSSPVAPGSQLQLGSFTVTARLA